MDTDKIPRMPWRDIHLRMEGEIVKDLSRNFIQYWSFVKSEFRQQKETRLIGDSKIKQQQADLRRANTQSPLNRKKPKSGAPFKFKSEFKVRNNTGVDEASIKPLNQNATKKKAIADDLSIIEEDSLLGGQRRTSKAVVLEDDEGLKHQPVRAEEWRFRSFQHTAKAELDLLIFKVKNEALAPENVEEE